MKKVYVKYNPYNLQTQVLVDGKAPKSNSRLNFENLRLQEWVDDFPKILVEEYNDRSAAVEFVGTSADFDDIKASFDASKSFIQATLSIREMPNVSAVENTIDKIFADIQAGPIMELRDPSIAEAFASAKNSQFDISVVATMSSGKSTLINALLGKQLMPAANEATTATIVRIVDTSSEKTSTEVGNYSAIAYDKSHNKIAEKANVGLEDMKKWNGDARISEVELRGHIPFVESVGMKLVLVDTPGPNNSRDTSHRDMTYKMLADSEKSLVLYVMNATQMGVNDEKNFLDYICDCMKKGGKQGRDRFIFAVNKMDSFNPKVEGEDCVERALEGVMVSLEERGIMNPNIFPVSSLVALEYRTEDDDPSAIYTFQTRVRKYNALHFNEFYKYSHLPQTARNQVEELLEDCEDPVEIYSGIISIEQAISLYVNKYARTTKVKDLVLTFNGKLEELSAVANLEKKIRDDKAAKIQLDKQVEQIQKNISTARQAQTFSKKIDGLDLTSRVLSKIKSYMEGTLKKTNSMMSGRGTKIKKSDALAQCRSLEQECKSLQSQIKAQIDVILQDSYKQTVNEILNQYKQYLKDLNLGIGNAGLSLNSLNLVSGALGNLTQILNSNTSSVDEGSYVTEEYKRRVEGGFFRKAASFLTLGFVDDHTYETAYRQKWVSKNVDYVDMNDVASDYIVPFQASLKKIQAQALDFVQNETERIKEVLKGEIKKIDSLLDKKLEDLKSTTASSQAKSVEIAKKENDLKWLTEIQRRVNNIVEW